MNHLLFGSLLVISLNAKQCNQEHTKGGTSGTPTTEAPANEGPGIVVGDAPDDQMMGPIEGKRWYIVSMEGSDLVVAEGGERPYIDLNQGQLQGFGGCNNLMGSYMIEGSQIHFTEVGSTKKYCPELQATERTVLTMLSEVNAYLTENDSMALLQGTRELAILRTMPE